MNTAVRGGFLALLCWAITGSAQADPIQAFLDRHWARPLAAQGEPPAGVAATGLRPEDCGTCHAAQLKDWKGSRHAQAMGPGMLGQLVAWDAQGRQVCLDCHAPLAEQARSLGTALDRAVSGRTLAPGLHGSGLVCAACHVRGYRWVGPPRRDGSAPDATGARLLPHRGWRAQAAFEDSRFCGACHQFDAGGFALNGKLLENTVAEWRASPYPARGVSCQSCHMPDRRHRWRGIHDRKMVARGVTIETRPPKMNGTRIAARLRLRNTGTGHRFPTYVTPAVTAEIAQLDAAGKAIAGSVRQLLIARRVPLDLSREEFDTRIAPGEAAQIDYRVARVPGAVTLRYQVRVAPDAFYARFYAALLDGELGQRARKLLTRALGDARASVYTLYTRREALPAGS